MASLSLATESGPKWDREKEIDLLTGYCISLRQLVWKKTLSLSDTVLIWTLRSRVWFQKIFVLLNCTARQYRGSVLESLGPADWTVSLLGQRYTRFDRVHALYLFTFIYRFPLSCKFCLSTCELGKINWLGWGWKWFVVACVRRGWKWQTN